MPVTEMIVTLSAGLFMLTAFVYFLRLIQAWMLHRSLREAIAKDSTLAGTLVERIDGRDRNAQELRGDDRNGLVLVALGVALIGFALIVNDPAWLRYGLGAALFPMLVGIALIARHVWLRRVLERDIAAGRNGDAELCARSAAGDRSAFGELVARHENRLRAFLTHLAGSQLGDDLAQESFVKAWQSVHQFRGQAKFASWVCSIGWRCFIDDKRRQRSDARKAEAAAWLADRVEMPASDERMDLSRALALLDPVERAALVLCEGHGWSHGEAAEILGVPLGTLKSRVKRAKEKCRILLSAEPQ